MDHHSLTNSVPIPNIFLFGDSQTQEGYSEDTKWVSLVSSHFVRRCDVLNRGFTGYNTRWAKMILSSLLDPGILKRTAAVTIFLGSNDANIPEIDPRLHVPIDEYRENITSIINMFQDAGVDESKIIVITPPPVDEMRWQEYVDKHPEDGLNSLRNDVMKNYADACKQTASSQQVTVIDLYGAISETEDWRSCVEVDGLHLSCKGGQLLYSLLRPELEQRLINYHRIYPEWDQINYKNPQESLLEAFNNNSIKN